MAVRVVGRLHRLARRRASVVALAVAASGFLVACGGDDDSSGEGGSSVVVLDDDQAKKAVLTLDNMPDGFQVSKDDEDDDEDAPGCLKALDKVDNLDSEADADASYEQTGEVGLPQISNGVASFKSSRDVSDALDRLRKAFDDCNHLDYTDPKDDTKIVLDFERNNEHTSSGVDDQFNLYATGTISSGLEFPFGFWLSVARIDNNTTTVMVTDLDEASKSLLDPYMQLAVDRLVAVVNGEEPSVTKGPKPGSGNGGDGGDNEGGSFEKLPLDGGEYTWDASGVTMKLTIDRVEPWGKKDDFCGDGSCGVANPDDTRVVIKYEVTVPANASEPFDPSSCPGDLLPTSGSEDDAIHGVMGDFYKPLNGKVFPGTTKTGADEYAVEKAYVDKEFYIESSCGDTDFGGETAYFVGTFNAA